MFKELYDSYIECSKNKSNTKNALVFTIEKEKNLIALMYDLQNNTYKVWKSIYFIVIKSVLTYIYSVIQSIS